MSVATPGTLPIQRLLGSLAAWRAGPTDDGLAQIGAGIEAVCVALGADGAWLELRAPSFEQVETGWGTLMDGPTAASDLPGLDTTTTPLRLGSTAFAIGRIVVSGDAEARDATGRALALAAELDWARAEVGIGAQRLVAFDAATRAIAGELDLDRVLQVIVDHVRPLVGARYAALGTVGPDGTFDRFISSGVSSSERTYIGHMPIGLGLLGHVIHERASTRVTDLAADPRRHGFPPHHPEMRTFLGVPVTVNGEAVGHLYLTDKTGGDDGFDAADQQVVETFARHAAISLERARLHQQVQHLAVADERDRIGRDLHDGIIQSLYAVGLSLEDVPEILDVDRDAGLARVDSAIDALHAAIRDIRNFITGLQPELLAGGALERALGTLADEVRDRGITVRTELAAVAATTPDQAADITHFVREALSNIVRHAAATEVQVLARRDGRSLVLTVRDDGRGYDAGKDVGSEHHGLGNLRTRATNVGGNVMVATSPGSGTTVRLTLPVQDL